MSTPENQANMDPEDKPLLADDPNRAKQVAASKPTADDPRYSLKTYRGIPMWRWYLGFCYMLGMGVCGIVLVALGSTLEDLAENCGSTAVDVGTVFIARGAGAILGSIMSAKLYAYFEGNKVMVSTLLLFSCLLLYMPYVNSVVVLHFAFFFLGLATAITDTGCQIMTRKIHGLEAGPWLGANTVAFGISGAIVPLIAYITQSVVFEYNVLVGITLVTSMFMLSVDHPDLSQSFDRRPGKKGLTVKRLFEYRIEWIISTMIFFLLGGKVAATAYFESYVDDTGVIPEDQGDLLIVALWIAITIGRLAGLQDQRFMNLRKLYNHLTWILIIGALGALLILAYPTNDIGLWIGVVVYGLFNGPCVGFCYDLNNRITEPSEKGMSVVMFGLNSGASIIPYLVSLAWDPIGPIILIITIFVTMVIPLPLLHVTRLVSGQSKACGCCRSEAGKEEPPVSSEEQSR